MSAEAELQIAISNALSAGLSDPVFAWGDVPDNLDSLYVVIGDDTFIEYDTDGLTGFEATVVIHTWDTRSSNRSQIPLKNLKGEIYDLLHRAELVISGYNVITVEQEFSDNPRDPDGLTRHGVQRFRILMRA